MSSEQRGFVFSVTFIIIFAALLGSVPVGLLGSGIDPDMVIPVNPSLISGFADSVEFNGTDFSPVGPIEVYEYDLGGFIWRCSALPEHSFQLGAKVLIAGFLWLGQLDSCKFISPYGEDLGGTLDISEIEEDAIDGQVKYELLSIGNGVSRGWLVFYWNETEYSDPVDAWDADELYLLHGVGFDANATSNIGSLIVSLLLLQLPDVPLLVNILIAVPIWAGIVFVLWFIIKEMIPFV